MGTQLENEEPTRGQVTHAWTRLHGRSAHRSTSTFANGISTIASAGDHSWSSVLLGLLGL
eukprot:6508426-Pyramimonas_sp.AAC.1